MIQYHGSRFVGWTNDFILAGLARQGIVRVRVSGATASEAARISLGARIREVEEAPDGAIPVLQDGAAAKLVELLPNCGVAARSRLGAMEHSSTSNVQVVPCCSTTDRRLWERAFTIGSGGRPLAGNGIHAVCLQRYSER